MSTSTTTSNRVQPGDLITAEFINSILDRLDALEGQLNVPTPTPTSPTFPTTFHTLPTTFHTLPTTFHTLPTTFHTLPTTFTHFRRSLPHCRHSLFNRKATSQCSRELAVRKKMF